jgi:hypothetical protein
MRLDAVLVTVALLFVVVALVRPVREQLSGGDMARRRNGIPSDRRRRPRPT